MKITEDNKLATVTQKIELPTHKQLERTISQKFYALYRHKLGCSPKKIICKIFNNYLIIIGEEAITPLEMTIKKVGQTEILREIRQRINQVLKSQLKELIKEITMVEVIDLICDLNYSSSRIIVTAILTKSPQVRNQQSSKLSKRS